MPFGFGSAAFIRSRSAQRASILSSIRCSSTSAELVGILRLELKDFLALAADLHAHALDLRTDEFECGHILLLKLT
ncbi:hypothetical protein AC628_39905 [Bradyrhizobium sp. NAS96.2]|nr:hypothetical protein AC628_39905 [Bradyrhizobium sp. NAS96.2]